jgi:2-methylcitrate dehydratase PrpD
VLNNSEVTPRDITGVKVRVGQTAMSLCQPDEARRRPGTVMDAKVSIPFVVGLAMARRGLSVRDFSVDALRDPAVLAETDKVSYEHDQSLDVTWPVITAPGIIEVTTSSGNKITKRIEHPYGNPHRPMSAEAVHAKFVDCAAHAAVPLPPAAVERVMELLDSLETSSDVAAIPKLLGGD